MKIKLTLLAISSTFVFAACSSTDPNPGNNNLPAKSQYNVSYGTDQKQQMDIYLPANRSSASTKVMILVHGGAWIGGDKLDFGSTISTIQTNYPDYAIFNLNYRLAALPATNPFPTQELDIKKALQFIYDSSQAYQISNKWVMVGTSAGGHLSLLQAYKYTSPVKIKAVVNYYGPSDMVAMHDFQTGLNQLAFEALLGGSPTTNPNMYGQSSPITFINSNSTPTITFQGSADGTVPPAQQTQLHALLNAANVPNQIYVYPGEGHGFSSATYSDSYVKMKAFLNQYNP